MNNLNSATKPERTIRVWSIIQPRQPNAARLKREYRTFRAANLIALMVSLAALHLYAQGVTNDVALDFSTNSNPNGVWTYGYSTSLGGSLNLYADKGYSSGLLYWQHNLSLGAPSLVCNSTTNTLYLGTPVFGPGQAAFHPGPNGEYSVYRFTAPASGSYRLESSFVGCDTAGTTTDVHVLLNSTPIFNAFVSGFGPNTGPTFNTNLVFQTDDQVDFAIGFGNGAFWNDSTGISARLVRDSPRLSIFRTTTNTVAVTWQSPSTGWELQQNTNSVSSVNWSNVTASIQDDGMAKTLIVNPPTGNRFYRLHKP